MKKNMLLLLLSYQFWLFGDQINWQSPEPVENFCRRVDRYDVAVNCNGEAIAILDEKIFASYNTIDKWLFFKHLNLLLDQRALIDVKNLYFHEKHKNSSTQTVVIDDSGRGLAVFTIKEGKDSGKIGCMSYHSGKWQQFFILSKEKGIEPKVVQSPNQKAMVVWLTPEEKVKKRAFFQAAYYNGTQWSDCTPDLNDSDLLVDIKSNSFQVGMDDKGNAIIIGVLKTKHSAESHLVGYYFNKYEERWMRKEIASVDHLRDVCLTVNGFGQAGLVWSDEEGVTSAYFDSVKSEWTKEVIARGELLTSSKIIMDEVGNRLIVWFDGMNNTICSACYRKGDKLWTSDFIPTFSDLIHSLKLGVSESGSAYLFWCSESNGFLQTIYSKEFDFQMNRWRENCSIMECGFIKDFQGVTIASANYGMILWFDSLQEKLFFSLFKKDLQKNKKDNPSIRKQAIREKQEKRKAYLSTGS